MGQKRKEDAGEPGILVIINQHVEKQQHVINYFK